jgi:UDP:flavonoid glycosyltransferase YjiC (YdhE family)
MSRFLFATQPITGHVLPAALIVRALVDRGHDVLWYVGKKFRARAEAAGAGFVGYEDAYDYDDSDYDSAFPGRSELTGLDQIRFDLRKLFIEQATSQYRDLRRILQTFPADALVSDPSMIASAAIDELGGPANAVYNVTCLSLPGREIAPFGLGLLPSGSLAGRLRNRTLQFVAPNVVFRVASRALMQACDEIGIRRRKFTGIVTSPYLFLEPTVAAFEYRRSDLPPQVHFIGALLPDPPAEFAPPPWWGELVDRRRPVVLVTQGTVATSPGDLVAPTVLGLAEQDVLVIVAGVRDAAALGLPSLPGNVRVEPFIPFKPLLPLVDVYVTNGGFGGVQYALANGVPIIAAGTTEDKPEIGNRVAYSGAGINLKTGTPTPQQVSTAVQSVLTDPRYRAGARAIETELRRHDAPQEAATLLERLADTKQPVLRDR